MLSALVAHFCSRPNRNTLSHLLGLVLQVVHPVLLDSLTDADATKLHTELVTEQQMLFARKAPALVPAVQLDAPVPAPAAAAKHGPPHMFASTYESDSGWLGGWFSRAGAMALCNQWQWVVHRSKLRTGGIVCLLLLSSGWWSYTGRRRSLAHERPEKVARF